MAHSSADVLILRSVPHGDHDRLVTAVSAEGGRVFAIVKGATAMHRRELAATEPFTWANMEFYEKNGFKWVKSATVLDSFYGLRYDMDKLFLAAYIADVVYELTDEREPAGDILPLALNTLYALAAAKGDNARIKAAFELRAACIEGFTPDLGACGRCHGEVTDAALLDVMNGAIICRRCFDRVQELAPLAPPPDMGERNLILPLDGSALAAFRYVIGAAPRRLLAFRLSDEQSLKQFAAAAESYLLNHLERGFASLENYKKLASFTPAT